MIETSNWKKVVSAVLSAALVAGLGWLVTNFANIAFFATHPLIAAATLAGVVSLLKQLGTTDEGKFAGAIPIK